jgi:hypothetical protein
MPYPAAYPYETRLNILHGPLERIDVLQLVEARTFAWYNQTLCRVNDSVVRLGVVHRPRAPERTVILMVEGAGIVPTGTGVRR